MTSSRNIVKQVSSKHPNTFFNNNQLIVQDRKTKEIKINNDSVSSYDIAKYGSKEDLIKEDKDTKYFAQPSVRRFNDVIRERAMKRFMNPNPSNGDRPFVSMGVDKVASEFNDFLALCQETGTIPTITGTALYMGIDRDLFYNHANSNSSQYKDIAKYIIFACNQAMELGTLTGKVPPNVYNFIAKNQFGYKDQTEITLSPKTQNVPNTSDTINAIKEQLVIEHKDN